MALVVFLTEMHCCWMARRCFFEFEGVGFGFEVVELVEGFFGEVEGFEVSGELEFF